MDVFGAGCAIAELFLEDAPGFTAHTRQLFKFREGELSVDGTLILGTIEDEGVRTMAMRYLEMPQALKANGIFKLTTKAKEVDDVHHEVSWELGRPAN
ncbi:hypothetical protein FIBSPDRAFT_953036 [Athelia psychrophila]|uniref:Uncharacterized protein n=1 Tax=Athelia psychrophila TaxID=1759441 RepID=A0A166KRI9_9AGAM|nr:hypothetical protein FIBSPDRAFT_953036 [Fibularhizoctonia sp. CBS 109695]